MNKKILIMPAWYPHEEHPVSGIFVHDQAKILALKYQVYVLFIERLDMQRAISRALKGSLSFRNQRKVIDNVHILQRTFVTTRFLGGFINSFLYVIHAYLGFLYLLKNWGKPDLIHAHVILPAGSVAAMLGNYLKIPVILTEHSGPFKMHLKTLLKRTIVLSTLRQFSRIISVSPSLQQELYSLEPNAKHAVIGNVISGKFFQIDQDASYLPGKIKILTVALLTKEKGIPYLIKAAKILAEKKAYNFEVLIGGDGVERKYLENLVKENNLSNYIRFLGLLTREQVRDYMHSCDIFVSSSLHESFGIVIGEAMACGKPVIATKCGGPEFIIEPGTGLLVNPKSPHEIADGIEKIIKGEVTFDPIRIQESVTVRFGEEAFLKKISDLYESVWEENGFVHSSREINPLTPPQSKL